MRFFHSSRRRAGAKTQQSRGTALLASTRMREYGSVSIPQEAFIAALRMGEE